MIAERDIENYEKVIDNYRKIEKKIAYEEEKLSAFNASSRGPNSSYNLYRRIGDPTPESLSYILEATEILPIIENRIKVLKKVLNNLKFPITSSCTTIE